MQGISMNELCELISHNHEAEFEYNGTTFVLLRQGCNPKLQDRSYHHLPLAAKCIAKCEITVDGDIPQEIIDAVLSEKCFDGKSFLEIENDIIVTVIF